MNLKVPKPCEKCDGVGDVVTTIALPVACIVVALQASHPTALLRSTDMGAALGTRRGADHCRCCGPSGVDADEGEIVTR